jgi:hypothetical protein
MTQFHPSIYLDSLINCHDLIAIKAEFEAEGSTLDELCALSHLCSLFHSSLTVKVGGPSAQRDFYESCELGAKLILVPMIESSRSLDRSLKIFSKSVGNYHKSFVSPKLAINIESKEAVSCIDSLIKVIKESDVQVSTIVIGRSDLSSSYGIDSVDDDFITDISANIIRKFSPLGIEVTIGGSVTSNSYDSINYLAGLGALAFETRKCTLSASQLSSRALFNTAVQQSLEFERSWLVFKSSIYETHNNIDIRRIESLTQRLSSGN